MREISLALTHYNRYQFLLEAISQVINDPRIGEIVISDDASTDGSYEELQNKFRDNPKVKLFRNDTNLDCYFNKAKAVERCSNPWIILFDSDNVLSVEYLNRLFAIEVWDPNTIYCPEFAEPHLDYTQWSGKVVDWTNIMILMTPLFQHRPHRLANRRHRQINGRSHPAFSTVLNTCNYFVHRDNYLSVWDGSVNPHTADSIFQAYNWIRSGRRLQIVPGLRYFHRIHDASHYKINNKKTGNLYRDIEERLKRIKPPKPSRNVGPRIMQPLVKPLTYGRMGNFLFQAAAAIGYAKRHGLEFTLPNTTKNARANPIYLQHLVKPFYTQLPHQYITEKSHNFQELPFDESWRKCNIILDGYWQTEKYFKDYRKDIIELFGYPWKSMPGFVSVHVRRGDYLTLTAKHPPVPLEWILGCMDQFKGYHFIFFSDDILWCRRTFGQRRDVTFAKCMDEEDDLIYMTHCEHHICSASTFSWWGAWLNQNPNKRILIPQRWFMPGRPEDTSDIVPPEWERI